MNLPKMYQVRLDYLTQYWRDNFHLPTYREMAAAWGAASPNTATHTLAYLEEAGALVRGQDGDVAGLHPYNLTLEVQDDNDTEHPDGDTAVPHPDGGAEVEVGLPVLQEGVGEGG